MKDMLSKEHYCYKTHILLIKSSAYSLIWTTPPFLQENLDPPSTIFQKSQPPKGVHTMPFPTISSTSGHILQNILWAHTASLLYSL